MAFLSNLHTHTTYSDGIDTPETTVKTAIEKGFVSLGFSEHVPAPPPMDSYQTPPDEIPSYFNEIASLKERYRGRIELYIGLESDYYASAEKWRDKLDFIIGSVHTVKMPDGELLEVDYLPEMMESLIAHFGAEGLVRTYYRQISELVRVQRPDILGHMDLLTKLNAGMRFFYSDTSWYRTEAGEAIQAIAECGCIVEVNTGAISRGYTTVPYPSESILRQLFELGVPVTISSDAHAADMLDSAFDQAEVLLRRVGYRSAKQLRGGRFIDVEL